jgi:rRNA maturation endonuclease Nob1
MTRYEQDFIYKMIPGLTSAIYGLTQEIKRYNDSKDKDIEMEWIDDVISSDNGDNIPIQVCPKCKTFFLLSQTGGGHHFCPSCGQKFKVKEVSDG